MGNELGVKCNLCGKDAPRQDQILKGKGLNNMGWQCSGGTRVCPSCVASQTEGKQDNGND
jgi:hypothetical protein